MLSVRSFVGLRMKIHDKVTEPRIQVREQLYEPEKPAPASHPERLFLVCCGDLSPAWENVLLTLYNTFGWLAVRYTSWSEFSSEMIEGSRVDILVISSDQVAALREDYKRAHHDLQNSWLMVQVDENRLYHLGPNSPKLIASFSRNTTEEDLLILFSKTARDWTFARGRLPLPAMHSGNRSDRKNEGPSVGMRFVRTLESVSSLVKVRKSVFGLAGAEPYLSMILQVAHAIQKGTQVDLTSLSAELDIPLSTLTRKLDYLCDVGLLVRSPDEDDRRRVIIQLTEEGLEKVRRYVDYIVGTL